jgi:phosphoribosylformylglycinamidine (FGAM) synthase-like enzyme
VQEVCRMAARRGLLASAHDCSEGGLAVTLAESCIAGQTGFVGDGERPPWGGELRRDAVLFGESQSRIVVSCRPEALTALETLAGERAVPLLRLGRVGGDRFQWADAFDVSMEEVTRAWNSGLS